MRISTSPCTILFKPSKALTTMLLGFNFNPSQSSLSRAFLDNTFRDEPVLPKHEPRLCLYIQPRYAMPHYASFLLALNQRLKNLDHYLQSSWLCSLETHRQMSLRVHGQFSGILPRLLHAPLNIVVIPVLYPKIFPSARSLFPTSHGIKKAIKCEEIQR